LGSAEASPRHCAGAEGAALGPGVLLDRLKARAGRLFTRSNRNVLVELVRAGFRVSDHNSILGVLWSLLAPVAMLLVLYFVFRERFGSEVAAYPAYVLLGVVLVGFFVTCTSAMVTVLLAERHMLLNSTVPRETLVASNLAGHLYKLLLELLLCAGFSAFYGLLVWPTVLLAIPLVLAYVGLVVGVGLVLALAHAFARDVQQVWLISSRLLFFATPVFYGLDSVSPGARTLLYWLNPLTPFLLALRDAFMDTGHGDGGWGAFWHSLLLGSVALAVGYSAFLALEDAAVERV
jgi:ABC-type polysaccharide/polyol phosphate export permease